MTKAAYVPPTSGQEDDDAWEALAEEDLGELATESFERMRAADGFSYVRSLAFQIVLTLIPGIIVVVAVAVAVGAGELQTIIEEAVASFAPGPAGDVLLSALEQGSEGRGNLIAMVAGGLAAVISGVAAMAQLQRGASRIYGVQIDRPTVKRYVVATALALTVGLMLAAAFAVLVLGGAVGPALESATADIWVWARWPAGMLVAAAALGGIFKFAPNRPQPGFSWLALGGLVAVAGWIVVSVLLTLYLGASSAFGETYGPLAGFMGLMIWAQLSAMAIFYGVSVAAQLEAERAGVGSPVAEETRGDGGRE